MSDTQKQIFTILDTDKQSTGTEDEAAGFTGVMTLQECRKNLLALERSINKNRELRVSSPRTSSVGLTDICYRSNLAMTQKSRLCKLLGMRRMILRKAFRFVDSEMSLDSALHSLLLLTQDAAAYYPELVRLGVATTLVDLLSRAWRVSFSLPRLMALGFVYRRECRHLHHGHQSARGAYR